MKFFLQFFPSGLPVAEYILGLNAKCTLHLPFDLPAADAGGSFEICDKFQIACKIQRQNHKPSQPNSVQWFRYAVCLNLSQLSNKKAHKLHGLHQMNPLCIHFMCKNWLNYQTHPSIQHHNFFKFVWQNSQRYRPFNALSNAKFLRDLIFEENQQSRSKSIRWEQNKKAHKQHNIFKFRNKISIHYTTVVNL